MPVFIVFLNLKFKLKLDEPEGPCQWSTCRRAGVPALSAG
jgi:hypothetical protein